MSTVTTKSVILTMSTSSSCLYVNYIVLESIDHNGKCPLTDSRKNDAA